jgi:hypothetical protein
LFENQVQKREKIQSSQRHFSRFVLLPPVYAQCMPYTVHINHGSWPSIKLGKTPTELRKNSPFIEQSPNL